MKPDLNSGKPDLRLTAIRDPEQTTPASQLPFPENKTKKRKRKEKQKTQNSGNHKKARRTDP
jgi:hypothetical protein